MDMAFGQITALKDRNTRLKIVNRELQPQKRQRLEKRPNKMFVDVQRALTAEDTPSRRRLRPGPGTEEQLAAASLLTAAYREQEFEHQFQV